MEHRNLEVDTDRKSGDDADRTWLSWRTWWHMKTTKWFPIGAQIATIIISLAALIVISKELWIYDQQRQLMSETKTVMAEQNEIIRAAQRAYVGVASLKADLAGHKVVILLENVGQIPAKEIRMQLREVRRKAGEPSVGSITLRNYDQIFPGELKMRAILPLDRVGPTEVTNILEMKEILYVSVTLQYDDGFGEQKTSFFFEYIPPPNEDWIAVPEAPKT